MFVWLSFVMIDAALRRPRRVERHKRFAPGKTLAQGGFIPPEQVKSPKGEATTGSGTQTKGHDFRRALLFGGPERDRTVDLSDANRTLSQLSYRPL